MRRRSVLGLIPLGLLYATQAAARSDQPSPEELAKFGFDVFKQGRIAEFADLLAADALSTVRQAWQEMLARADGFGKQQLLHALNISSAELLDELPNAELLGRFHRLVLGDADVLTELEFVSLGHLAEGDQLVHVLYQLKSDDGRRMPPRCVTLVRNEGSWSLGLLGDFSISSSTTSETELEMPRTTVRVIGRLTLTDGSTAVCYRLRTATKAMRLNKVLTAHVKSTDTAWSQALQGDDKRLAAFINQEIRKNAQKQLDQMRSLLAR